VHDDPDAINAITTTGSSTAELSGAVSVQPCLLNQLNIGCRGCVVSVGGDPEIKRRLLEMGFCAGTCVEVVRRAPLSDPTEFRLRGYFLSLREEQARHVVVLPQL
jgi:Fe2+ transport system protein FeoA